MNGALVNTADIWWRWVAEATWQSAVVGIFILLIVALGKRWPSPLRYALLLIALLKFMTPPLWTAPTGLFSQMTPVVKQTVNGDASFRPNPFPVQPAPLSVRPSPEFADEGSDHKGAKIVTHEMEDQSSKSAPHTQTDLVMSDKAPAVSATSAAPRELRPSSSSTGTWKTWLMLIHFAGSAVVAILILKRIRQLRRLVAGTHPVTDERLPIIVRQLTSQFRIRRQVRLLCSAKVTAPVSFGIIQPTVLLPGNTNNLKTSELTSVLAHDLVHLSRGDAWLNWLQLFATAIWWFHPVIWVLNRTIRQVREDCCDDAMLAAKITTETDYCETLIKVAAIPETTAGSVLTFSMAAGLHPVAKRMRRIMDPRVKRKARLSIAGAFATIALACFFLPGLDTVSQPVEAAKSKSSLSVKTLERRTVPLRARVFLQNKGRPAKQCRIRVASVSPYNEMDRVPDGHWKDVHPDTDGSVSVKVPAPGVYQIAVAIPGFASAESEPIDTGNSSAVVTDIVLQRGIKVHGRVFDEDGLLMHGAEVVTVSLPDARPPSIGSFVPDKRAVKTRSGLFTLRHAPKKRKVFRVTHPDIPVPAVAEFDLQHSVPFSLNIRWLDFTLKRGCTIQGQVFDADGKPAAGEFLHFHHEHQTYQDGLIATTKTDADGFYHVENLPAELLRVQRQQHTGAISRLVQGTPEATHTVNLGGQRKLTGTILINGQPARHRTIRLSEDFTPEGIIAMVAKTNADGAFAFHGAPPGSWGLYLQSNSPDKRMGLLRKLEIPRGRDTSVGEINRIEGSLTITCNTTGWDSELDETHLFRLIPTDSEAVLNHYWASRIGDQFVIEGIVPGHFHLLCHAISNARIWHKVEVSADNLTPSIDVAMPVGPASLSGTIHGTTRPSMFSFWSEDKHWKFHANVADDGSFHVNNLPASTWAYKTFRAGPDSAIKRFATDEGQQKIIAIRTEDRLSKNADLPLFPSDKSDRKSGGVAQICVCLANGVVTPCDVSVEGPDGPVSIGPSISGRRRTEQLRGTYHVTARLAGFDTVTKTVKISEATNGGRSRADWKINIRLTK